MPKDAPSTDPSSMSRRQQFVATYRMAKKTDPRLGLVLLGTFVAGAAAGFVVFWLLPPNGGVLDWIMAVVGALLLGLLATVFVFGRRAQRSAKADGGPTTMAPAKSCLPPSTVAGSSVPRSMPWPWAKPIRASTSVALSGMQVASFAMPGFPGAA